MFGPCSLTNLRSNEFDIDSIVAYVYIRNKSVPVTNGSRHAPHLR
jgi:hypothetical protein